MSEKLTYRYQKAWENDLFYGINLSSDIEGSIKRGYGIDENVKLHNGIKNPLSSQAACFNVLGSMKTNKELLLKFLNHFSLGIQEIIDFPQGINIGNRIYNDVGPVIFEWVGPKQSPINEVGGGRGFGRTSIDAYLLAMIKNKVTQILIEWKFSEKYETGINLHKFGGKKGIERLRRYSDVLDKFRRSHNFPFNFMEEGSIGLYDFGYEPLYQLMRVTLLAKTTTPLIFQGSLQVENYRVIHFAHSANEPLLTLSRENIKYCPGLTEFVGKRIHDVWSNDILTEEERTHFTHGYWDTALPELPDSTMKDYLIIRYG